MEPHIAIFPTPGMGHLIPLVGFAKVLIQKHNFNVTFIIPTDGPLSNAQKSFLEKLPPRIDYVVLPPVNFDDLSKDAKIETRIALTVTRSLSSLRNAVKSLISTKRFAAFVVDLFGTDAFDVANEFKISPYIFYPTTAMCLSLFLNLSKIDESVSCEYRDMSEKLRIPGCMPIHGSDLLDPIQDRKNDAYKWILHHSKRYGMAAGIILNSFKELEPGAIEYLQEKETGKPPVYCIGPLIQMGSKSENNEEYECSKWLDEQPSSSVLYISFGSGGTLSHEQIIEIALGLEMSEQRFLWVLRCPSDTTASAAYFSIQNSGDPLAYLPQGFLDRTKGRGLVVPLWAPQAQILSHDSTGGFLSHCGWNSTLESIVNGVPLIAWPLYAEQRMNAVMLTEDVKVALRPKSNEKGLVTRLEIAKVVKGLMEGEEGKGIRSRMRDLKDAAAKVLSDDGSSTKTLAELANKWKSNIFTLPN
ncbi:hydroquinone glucosyltransferase-like [Olea europaea var. sylvestris]|uniref:hydroquinone glucosyltransferase-like n=1 Tax=Olea europaea var. sylvestris TaxID=158386 RepID=UPI000C1D86BA|nr:hydroquinone glucosyltransferase-like [Olea europaea var. sylvestris]